MRLLERWVAPLVTQPLSRPVPADDAAYRARKGDLRLAVRGLRRALQYAAGGQAASRHEFIDPAWRRALWIHEEAPQIGDALMDLAPRSLLVEHIVEVDLLAPPSIAALFDGDRWIARAHADPGAIDPARHDFVICSSDARRALATKRRIAPDRPWISLAGRYGVPDYQRAMFVAQRLADLLRVPLDAAGMRRHARQKLELAGDLPRPEPDARARAEGDRAAPRPTIAIACGGVRAERTYPHWPAVATALAALGTRGRFTLVGSANGRAAADSIASALPPENRLHDLVGRLDLHATRAAIASADLLLCADGGLMHLGLTTPVPIVALFPSTIDPAWRLPPDTDGRALRSPTASVGDLDPVEVVAAALDRLAQRPSRPPPTAAAGHRTR